MLLMNVFFKSQLGYCPDKNVSRHSRKKNKMIKKLDEQFLRIIYNDKSSSSGKLLENDSCVYKDCQKLQLLTTEMLKTMSIIINSDTFKIK